MLIWRHSTSADEFRGIVAAINAAWQAGRWDELRAYFHPDAVLAQPGFGERTVGRDAVIASYRDFAAEATLHSFTAGETHVDAAGGDSAVTTTPWTMDYTHHGRRYQEHGWDLLVFARREERWVVAWRTVVVEG